MRTKRLQTDKRESGTKQRAQTRSNSRSRAQSSSLHPFLQLQQTIGNQSVQRLLKSEADEALTVSHRDDPAEQQAEHFAQKTIGRDTSSDPGLVTSKAESALSVDFSDVQIHHDARAAEAAKSINAKAFTVGHDIVFGEGQYAPDTAQGRKLIAHELVHVAQQRDSGASVGRLGGPGNAVQRSPDKPETKSEPRATNFKNVTMHFNGRELIVNGDKTEIFRFSGFSGRPVRVTAEDAKNCGADPVTDSYLSDKRFVGIKDHGPIPEGTYTFSAAGVERFTSSEESQLLWGGILGHKSEKIHGHAIHPGDWGSGRVELHPKGKVLEGPCGNANSRSEFFLHGGSFAGSSGCIDIGSNFDKLADFLEGYSRAITLTVSYEESPPSVGFFTGLGGAIAYKGGFGFTHGPTLRLGAEFAPTETRGVASLGYDAVLRWAGGAASAGLRLDIPFNDREAFVRLGLSGGLHFRIFRALHGELLGGYSWDVSGPSRASGLELGAGLKYDFGRVQLEALYDVLRPMANDQRVHQALLGIGFHF